MNEPTNDKLYAMRLGVMAEAWQSQSKDPKIASLTFDERFALLVDAEHLARDNRRLSRLLKDAQLRLPSACIEDVDTSPARGDRRQLLLPVSDNYSCRSPPGCSRTVSLS